MSDISKIDKNFTLETEINRDGIKWYDAKCAPIALYGVFHDGEMYRRMPDDVAAAVSSGVQFEVHNPAGGRIRFITDSDYIILKAKVPGVIDMSHMPRSGSCGFDLYVREGDRETYKKTFIPGNHVTSFEGVVDFYPHGERLVTINFPLYNDYVNEVYIGVHENAKLLPPTPYSVPLPMVSYGSSITQGGCASRPGNAYQAIISRRYDADFINLGFSGCAKGEPAMRDYLGSLEMSAFILDYDFNTPTLENLIETHKPIYEAVRAKNPDIPIVMMSRPNFYVTEKDARVKVIKDTYEYAKANGDDKVYFINSQQLFELCEDNGTVDGTHPNDFGFRSMANAVIKCLDNHFKPTANK